MKRTIFSRFNMLMVALAIISCSSWTSIASADLLVDNDSKWYPATTCVQSAGPHRLFYDRDGSIFNQDRTRSITVHCPILRDYVKSDTHLTQVSVHIGQANLKKCWIHVIEPKKTKGNNGYRTLASDYESHVRSSKGRRYYWLKFKNEKNYTRGALYMVGCELAPKSRMIAFDVLEQDD